MIPDCAFDNIRKLQKILEMLGISYIYKDRSTQDNPKIQILIFKDSVNQGFNTVPLGPTLSLVQDGYSYEDAPGRIDVAILGGQEEFVEIGYIRLNYAIREVLTFIEEEMK